MAGRKQPKQQSDDSDSDWEMASASGSEYTASSAASSRMSSVCEEDVVMDDDFEIINKAQEDAETLAKDIEEIEDVVRRVELNPSQIELDGEELLFNGNLHPPEYYRQNVKSLNEKDYDLKEYSSGTEGLIAMVGRQWRQFCTDILQHDWEKCIDVISLRTVYNFLEWYLAQRQTNNGHAKPGVRKRSSLVTFWCTFRLVFERNTNCKIDEFIDRRKMHNALVELASRYNLSDEKRENRSMTLADLKHQINTTLTTTEKAFKLGELRILAVLFLLFLAPAGSRPASILHLRFGDIRVVLVRDPANGPHRLLIKFTLNFTKKYLGKKAAKTFLIPEIIFDPSLLLSPHVFLLGILFRHCAFRSEALNKNPHKIAELDIHPDEQEMSLPLKEELEDVYVFRQTDQDLTGGYVMSNKAITKAMMTAWVRRIGELLGFEHTTICYSLRYMAGNRMDRNVNVSEALRNLVMDHAPNSDTFQKHYLNRNVCADLWAIHRDHAPQQALVEQATSHGHSRSSRRPVHLTLAQSKALNNNPQMVRLNDSLRGMTPRSHKYKETRLKIRALKARLFKAKKESIRKEWTAKQAVEDIDRQIHGSGFEAKAKAARRGRPMGTAQQRLIDALTAPLTNDLNAQYKRRADAIDAIIAYCRVEEPLSTKVLEARAPLPPIELEDAMDCADSPDSINSMAAQAEKLRQSVIVTTEKERLTRCFVCVGKALTLPPDDPNLAALLRNFHSNIECSRHLKFVHVKNMPADYKTECPICPSVMLKDKMHFQNHALGVHGVRS